MPVKAGSVSTIPAADWRHRWRRNSDADLRCRSAGRRWRRRRTCRPCDRAIAGCTMWNLSSGMMPANSGAVSAVEAKLAAAVPPPSMPPPARPCSGHRRVPGQHPGDGARKRVSAMRHGSPHAGHGEFGPDPREARAASSAVSPGGRQHAALFAAIPLGRKIASRDRATRYAARK